MLEKYFLGFRKGGLLLRRIAALAFVGVPFGVCASGVIGVEFFSALRASTQCCGERFVFGDAVCGERFVSGDAVCGGEDGCVVDTVFGNVRVRELGEVTVRPEKGRYSKRNNPAVRLLREVLDSRGGMDPRERPFYSFRKYEKMKAGLGDFDLDLRSGDRKKGDELRQYIDTIYPGGNRVLYLTLKELYSTVYSGSESGGGIERIHGMRSLGIDEGISQETVRTIADDFLGEIDIFSSDIVLLQNHFVSPLSSLGFDFYKYEITDTVPMGRNLERCVEVSFVPHNPESYSFNGKIYVPVSGSEGGRYVKRIEMRVPRHINLNYIRGVEIGQNYEKDGEGLVHKTRDNLEVDVRMVRGSAPFYASRQTSYDGFSYEKFAEDGLRTIRNDRKLVDKGAVSRPLAYWDSIRPIGLGYAEGNMDRMNDPSKETRFDRFMGWLLTVAFDDYIPDGNPARLEFGPVSSVLSHNDAEGWRVKGGFMTMPALNNRLFGRGYVAYGFGDRKFKYKGELEYSFRSKEKNPKDFPVHSLTGSYMYDTDQIGERYDYLSPDNILSSFTRMGSNLVVYERLARLRYELELPSNFSMTLDLERRELEGTAWIPFEDGMGRRYSSLLQHGFRVGLNYSPGQKFIQGLMTRTRVNLEPPIVGFTHECFPGGLLGSQFGVQKSEGSVWKRLWFSSFGYVDVLLRGGIVWGETVYPMLPWQNSNISYTIQTEAFSLLNPMEFAMDRYASVDLTYYMSGLILNRIPLVNRLKLREVVSFKGFVGSLSEGNDPERNLNLLRFPVATRSRVMGKRPYMELGVGLDNILSFLRLEYVWRLSYRDFEGVDRSGLRFALHFSF